MRCIDTRSEADLHQAHRRRRCAIRRRLAGNPQTTDHVRFARSRQAVLQKLLSIADPVSKIVVWCGDRTLPEKAWLLPAVNELARRSTSLTDHEGSRLGLENVLKMQRISDSYVCKCVEGAESCRMARRCKSRAGYDFSGMTRKEFMKK